MHALDWCLPKYYPTRQGTHDVALKLTQKNLESLSVLKTIESEVEVWGKVSHPGIVQLLDVFELPSISALVTELCSGGCLLDNLVDEAGMTEANVLHIGRQVVAAVRHLHEVSRVAHRDIKPENVLCTHCQPHMQGSVKLADFGFAVEFGSSEHAISNRFTRLVGTPEYLAPEMIAAFNLVRRGDLNLQPATRNRLPMQLTPRPSMTQVRLVLVDWIRMMTAAEESGDDVS